MSQKTAFHLTAGMCFVIALVLYVFGFAAPDNSAMTFFMFMGGFFEFLAWRGLVRSWRARSSV
jgi:hypothetical protein